MYHIIKSAEIHFGGRTAYKPSDSTWSACLSTGRGDLPQFPVFCQPFDLEVANTQGHFSCLNILEAP